MKSKEEIMHDHVDAHCFLKSNCIEATFDAMDEYAKQEAEAYEKWLYDSRYTRYSMPFSDLWGFYLESKKQKV